MKLSKEKHTRSAVANEEQNIGGILYRFPGKSIGGVKDQMLRRDKEVKKLYNVFNQIQVGTKPKKWNNDEKLSPEENERRAQQKNIKIENYKWREACSKYVKSSQKTINYVIFYSYGKAENKLRYMRKNEDILKKMQEEEKLPKFSGGKLEDFVAYTLRKSLVVSKYDTQEFDSVAAMVVFLECIGKSNISDHEKEIVCKLLELIRKDFSKLDPNVKGSQGANIVRSVRNQNMIVQPQGDRFLFPQVYAKENETVTNKNVEKEGLNEFLLNYANLDDEKRAESLRKLRRILDVYFSAPNHYEKDMDITLSDNIEKEKFNVWEKHECGKKETLRDIVEPVSKDNIEEFYSQKAEIAYCKIKGKEITAEEQKAVLKYQKLKNRVELRDIVEYGEIINELLGQLINWSFMRERDLLYFQLGFHYDCLRNDSKKPEGYKNIKVDENSIKDAILYQIIGMYVNGVTVYAPEKDGDKLKEQCVKGGVGVKVSAFHRYSKYLGLNEKTLYNAGLEIFEVVAEHEDIINLRNGIDHFKYYLGDYRSMLSIYSEVFDRFFTYDIKYQKNVLNLLQNILLRHNVIVEPILESGFKTIGEQTKPGAKLSIRSIKSDTFQYKVKGGTLITDAKDERYLETIRKILYYAENEEDNLKKSVVVTNADKYEKNKESDDQDKQKEKKNKDNKGKKNEETKSDAEKNNNERLSYNPFANLNFKLSN